ncbi:hypothetical protein HDU87_002038 [Geranomyces variabilis]|uniref:25S rRNA adenine-N(1) methyltransferase n=1 Tax=Geranomyces variabilis TaxID=109894 RepID=A0AAD5TPA2_9FUNG|nr:hypothetical protein HDU87_002038 [Geranomyces variabilis]
MAKRAKRVKPITLRNNAPPAAPPPPAAATDASDSKPRGRRKASTQKLIASYHTLNKKLHAVLKAGDSTAAGSIKTQMEAMGGLHAYQRASLRGGNEKKGLGACGSWLVQQLRAELAELRDSEAEKLVVVAENGEEEVEEVEEEAKTGSPATQQKLKLKLLDVGALDGGTYSKQASWIDVTSIDLNPQCQTVRKQDFFERPRPTGAHEKFNVLCLSLVVNFVGDPKLRGDMLIHARRFLLPRGLLFLVLPLPCVKNSRYMSHAHLLAILKSIGYELVKHHFARKLALYLLRRVEQFKLQDWTKTQMNPGIERNNFCIVVKRS